MDKCNCDNDEYNLILNKEIFIKKIPNDIFRQKLFFLIDQLLTKKYKDEKNNKYLSTVDECRKE